MLLFHDWIFLIYHHFKLVKLSFLVICWLFEYAFVNIVLFLKIWHDHIHFSNITSALKLTILQYITCVFSSHCLFARKFLVRIMFSIITQYILTHNFVITFHRFKFSNRFINESGIRLKETSIILLQVNLILCCFGHRIFLCEKNWIP